MVLDQIENDPYYGSNISGGLVDQSDLQMKNNLNNMNNNSSGKLIGNNFSNYNFVWVLL